MGNTSTVQDILSDAEKMLSGFDAARLEAEIILAEVLKIDRSHFYSHPEQELSEDKLCDFNILINRRTEGFPLSYLTGVKEFWSLELNVNQHTLIPRPETECLVEAALETIPITEEFNILDIGTGSGAIAIAIGKERPNCRITAIDISEEAIDAAKQNAAKHQITNIDFIVSNCFDQLVGQQFNTIISNPPYVASHASELLDTDIRFEPRLALDGGHHGLDIISEIIAAARQHLVDEGYVFLEHGYAQAEQVQLLLTNNQFSFVETRQDYAGLDRVSIARY